MPELYTTIGPWTLRTYTVYLGLGIAASTGFGFYLRREQPRSALADVGLGALLGAVVLARLGHVLLNWAHFSDNLGHIWRLRSGGLDWHAALLGGLLGLYTAARWRGINQLDVLDALTPALPLLAFAVWAGCWASRCGYGAELDTLAGHPAFIASEGPDGFGVIAPRYNTQVFGMLLSALVFLVALALLWAGWLWHVRFWLILALLGATIFAISFLRGEAATAFAGLQREQWLDITVIALALGFTITAIWRRTPTPVASD